MTAPAAPSCTAPAPQGAPSWTEAELAAALAGAMDAGGIVALRQEALALLGGALGQRGFSCGEPTHLATVGQADAEWLTVSARTVATVSDPLSGGRHLQAEVVLSCLGQFDTFPQSSQARRAQPVALTVRLELVLGTSAFLGAPLEAQSFRCGTVECSLGQAGRDAPVDSAEALVAWFGEAAIMVNGTPARERANRAATMAAELQFQLAP